MALGEGVVDSSGSARAPEPGTEHPLVQTLARMAERRIGGLRLAGGEPSREMDKSTELLGRMAMERMLAGVSTRRYPVALEPVGDQVEADAKSTSKSAVSRKFVAMTETALADLLAADLSGLDLVAIMIDGVHFADHLCVVALGIGIDGVKHPLAVVEGSTENTTLVRGLLVGLRDRGLDVTRPILAVLDGAKALSAAVGRCSTIR